MRPNPWVKRIDETNAPARGAAKKHRCSGEAESRAQKNATTAERGTHPPGDRRNFAYSHNPARYAAANSSSSAASRFRAVCRRRLIVPIGDANFTAISASD